MNRKLPTPRDYLDGTFMLVVLALPLVIGFIAIGAVYWTSRGIRALGTWGDAAEQAAGEL